MKCDTTTLNQIIDRCFDYAGDERLKPLQRSAFLADGKRLRNILVDLQSAQFNASTQAVKDANANLSIINDKLQNETTALNDIAATVKELATLVGMLNKLIGIAASFA